MNKAQSIKRKLAKSYIFFIIIFILFLGLLSNFVIQKQFRDYAIKNREHEIRDIVMHVTNLYTDSWDEKYIEIISKQALDNGYIISLTDYNNQVIFDANIHNGHECEMVIDGIIARMKENNPNWHGSYVTRGYEIKDTKNNLVGYLNIGYLSPYFYTEEDIMFLKTLNAVYLLATFVFIIIALFFASYMAKRLSRPLRKVVLATSNISRGIYREVPKDESNILEISMLTSSVNKLSTSLENQENIRKQLTSDVTHELRTPITTLQTHIEAMIDGVLDIDETQLKSIYEEILRLNNLVSDLDKLAQFDQNNATLNYEIFNIGELIEKILVIFNVQFKQMQVELDYQANDIYIEADQDKISQVMINLISNALKYTQSGNWVKIDIEEKNEIIIKVIDSGIGISPKDLPHIYERLYRADKSRNRHTGGSGIGLSIVKSIVLAHNGTIDAKSELNNGTEITICLPKTRRDIK